ncbi:MAG TPA: MFS transporter [Candidatus Deferrimicrobium sp.]|nr:MFS transporter [Candidatus Deferrimicrobium sp.]
MVENAQYEVTSYRWVVLGVFMFIGALTQLLWINFASIRDDAGTYYGVSGMEIDLLSLIFMLVYIGLAIPSSWVIDTRGVKVGAGFGAILTASFGVMRIFAGHNFMMVLIFQAGVALGQPFVMNAISKLSAQWFPEGERAIATGLGTMSLFIGIFFGMLLPPFLYQAGGVPMVLIIFGVVAVAGMVLFLIFAKEKPEKPPGPAAIEEKTFVWEGIKKLVRMPDFLILMVLVLIGMGAFNAIATFIEPIVGVRGDAGIIGAMIILGGIFGALVISTLSDKYRKRKIFIIIALGAATPLLLGVTFIPIYAILVIFALLFGFFSMSSLPIGLEFAAEQTAPIPEGTSNGILIMMGQIGGVIFILSFIDFTSTNIFIAMIILTVLLAVALVLCLFLKERPLAAKNK